ncbi:MAG: hypothetical protein E7391_06280 [Ruminococcaceae bacterium]|nr:hypothetical protein [Oscillospiraceae bacterium]
MFMKQSYLDLIELFSSASLGRELSLNNDVNLVEIFELANNANIWPIVFSAIKQSKIKIEKDTFSVLDKTVKFNIASYNARCQNVHKVIEKLEDENINVIVLKGETFSFLYHDKMFRTSSDTDLLIDAKDENKATKIMADLGLEIEKKSAVSHHTRCNSKKCGLIELHTDIYEDYIDSLYFNNFKITKDNLIYVEANDGFKLKTLSPTDGLYFNTFHFIKHFLSKGCGLKQLMDLILYISHYKNEIDFDSYINEMKKLNFDTLIITALGIGIKYFKFDKSDLFEISYDDKKVDSMLNDIIEGGAFGNGEKERKGFNDEFLKHKLKDDYISYKMKFNKNFFKKSASFKLSNIYSKYQYAKKNKLLIPIAYIHHIWYIVSKSFKRIFTKKEEINFEITEKRIHLMEELNILKKD